MITVPNGVQLTEGSNSTTSITVLWDRPNGIVESYEILCETGTANPPSINDTTPDSYEASCIDLSTPGEEYTITVISIVGTNRNTSSTVDLYAGK